MNRGQPFVVTGTAFLAISLVTYATGGDSAGAATWLSVGLAMLAVGAGLSRATPDDPEPTDSKRA